MSNHIRAGKLKLLAVTADKRNPAFSDAPTMKEAGVEGVEVYSWQAIAAPGSSDRRQGQARAVTDGSLNTPDVKGKFNDLGFEVVANTSAQFSEFLNQEISRWKTVVEMGKITVDQ